MNELSAPPSASQPGWTRVRRPEPAPTAAPPVARWRSLAAGVGGGLVLLIAGGLWVIALFVVAWNAVAGPWVGGTSGGEELALLLLASLTSVAGVALLVRARRLALLARG